MSALARVLLLAGVLVAPASFAQILGNQTGIMGGESGFFDPGVRAPLSIAALPYARTVTCTGAITLTGTATGAGAVSWAASPDGASGACTGTTSWSCDVAVSPNAAGEGVETITVSQSGGGSSTVDVGFYVAGAHSCFLAQSVDGTYNSTLIDADAVATWVNLGSSALNVTQATGSAQPSLRTSVVGGQPVVRCDGSDHLAASLAADWSFVSDGTGATIDSISLTSSTSLASVVSTSTSGSNAGLRHQRGTTFSARYFFADGAVATSVSSGNNTAPTGTFVSILSTAALADTPDLTLYINNASVGTPVDAPSFPVAPSQPLVLCARSAATAEPLTGDVTKVLIYASSLTSTQRGINLAVDEWALGGTLPVTP
jgi:hypothetical protein